MTRTHTLAFLCLSILALMSLNSASVRGSEGQVVNDPIFGKLKLVDSIECSMKKKGQIFMDYPAGSSSVQSILGKKCRVIANNHKEISFFSYRVGRKKGLKPGACYLLEVDYPEDSPRSIFIQNGGCESSQGIHTGTTVGDALKGRYVNTNPESLNVPLSGKYEKFRQVFFLHDNFFGVQRGTGVRTLTPRHGFWVTIAHLLKNNAPLSNGAAVRTIKLYEVLDEQKAYLPLNLPPKGLPRRHVFWREEMSDGACGLGQKSGEARGVSKAADWYGYKMRLSKILGIDTFCKDLLEFGHNQGWDSSKYGGNQWVNQSNIPNLWSDCVAMAGKYNLNVLPYYEYRGSVGQDPKFSLGKRNIPQRLDGGKIYTQITWCENQKVDITTKEAIEDTEKILDVTIVDEKKKANFIGAWFRPRPAHNPVSFTEDNFEAFSEEANDGNFVTRSQLQADKTLLAKYYKWWFKKRRQYLDTIRDYLRKNVSRDAFVLYTTDASESGASVPAQVAAKGQSEPFWKFKNVVVTDSSEAWKQYQKTFDLNKAISSKAHFIAIKQWHGNYGKHDWKHAVPPADPELYQDDDGVMLTHTINKLYTVSVPESFEAFRTKAGLAVVRHYCLNENEAFAEDNKTKPLGYFVADVERTGPYCMMAETVAMANGDPTLIGYLCSNNNTPGFPEYRRNFYGAFLSLPALPSRVVSGAASNNKVVVREIVTKKHGTYYSVSNTSMKGIDNIALKLNAKGAVYDAATGKKLAAGATNMKLSMYPYQLRALLVK